MSLCLPIFHGLGLSFPSRVNGHEVDIAMIEQCALVPIGDLETLLIDALPGPMNAARVSA